MVEDGAARRGDEDGARRPALHTAPFGGRDWRGSRPGLLFRHAGTGEEEALRGHPGEWADQSPGSQWDGKGDGFPVPTALLKCHVSRLGPECGKNKELGPGRKLIHRIAAA